jgi:hypothetical protein
MTRKQERDEQKSNALKWLHAHLKPGDTVYTTIHHVSRSGMSRSISLHIVNAGEIGDISGFAAHAMGSTMDHKRGGIKVGGCGMDMGFHLVYNLSRTMFPDGWACVGKDCRENHWGRSPEYKRIPKGKRTKHTDGGYAIKQRWI